MMKLLPKREETYHLCCDACEYLVLNDMEIDRGDCTYPPMLEMHNEKDYVCLSVGQECCPGCKEYNECYGLLVGKLGLEDELASNPNIKEYIDPYAKEQEQPDPFGETMPVIDFFEQYKDIMREE